MQALARRLASAPSRPWPDRPVPVSLVITDLDVGGAERSLVALARGLDSTRWQPSVIALGPEAALCEPLRSAGVSVTCLNVNRGRPIAAVARLAGALRSRRPALVQSFLFHANVATRLAAPFAGRPWVVGGIRVAERERNWHLFLERITSHLSTGSVCVSRGVSRFSQSVGRLTAERLTVIPNGIEPSAYDHVEAIPHASIGVPADAHLCLFVGRLTAQKGVVTLIEAAREVVADRADWHLALAGEGPERGFLEWMIQNHQGLNGRVHLLGRRDDIPALLQTADVLVLPSLWEGMPNVVLEAMAAGKAVISSAVEGTEDVVLPGETGWLVRAGDSHVLAATLLDAASDPERLRRRGTAGRARVEALYHQSRVVEAYDSLWSRVLGYAQTSTHLYDTNISEDVVITPPTPRR